jgi:hypothetical protein
VQFSGHHPELRLSRFIVPQVAGNIPRSNTLHRVVGSFLESKKYILPLAVASPILAGSLATIFVASGGGSFNPGHDAMILVPGNEPELPLTREERDAYLEALKRTLARDIFAKSGESSHEGWKHVQSEAQFEFDQNGRPLLQTNIGGQVANVGISAQNVLSVGSSPQLIQALLAARLQSELRRSVVGKVSNGQIGRDLQLLQMAIKQGDALETSLPSQPMASRGSLF